MTALTSSPDEANCQTRLLLISSSSPSASFPQKGKAPPLRPPSSTSPLRPAACSVLSDFPASHYLTARDNVSRRGDFRLRAYRFQGTKVVMRNGERVLEPVQEEPVVMYRGALSGREGVLVRVHDQCFTSEVLGSRCGAGCNTCQQSPHRINLQKGEWGEEGGVSVHSPAHKAG